MAYAVKEIFPTLQGEGLQTGRKAVFLRFAGCNLWNGREQDRAAAICQFCDTDFIGGTVYQQADLLALAVEGQWSGDGAKLVVITGGEPALQVDVALLDALHGLGFQVAIETNGTLALPGGLDWICVSPKAGTQLAVQSGDELKLVFPQDQARPELYEALDFKHFLLQPMDGPHQQENIKLAAEYCLAHPHWRLSLQTHKMIGLP